MPIGEFGRPPELPTETAPGMTAPMYWMYEMAYASLSPARAMSDATRMILQNPLNPFAQTDLAKQITAGCELFERTTRRYGKPEWGLHDTEVNGVRTPVEVRSVWEKPFCRLLYFDRKHPRPLRAPQPRVLIVAPMSGHYATLLRGTVEAFLPTHEVYITDWSDARQVPLAAGRFDLDDYIDYVVSFLEFIGPGAHVVAVCQPSVPALAATALMGAAEHPCRPVTLTMMGGPIDTREAPTAVNDTATGNPLSWFQNNLIATVPSLYPGEGRKVYPGFLQLAGFMWQNIELHMKSHYQMFEHLVAGDGESADASKAFYDEYRSVCDMTAEFYLQTVEHVFQRHSLPKGELIHRGKPIDLSAIRDTAILAIEGENDDISGIGQTRAALTLAKGLPEGRKKYHLAPEVGHYGIFNGSKWRTRIAPVVEQWMAQNDKARLKVVA